MSRGSRFHLAAQVLAWAGLLILGSALWDLLAQGIPFFNAAFLVGPPSEVTAGGGIGPELVNTVLMVVIAEAISLPLGMAAAIWRVEYMTHPAIRRLFDLVTVGFQSLPTIVVALVVFDWVVFALHWPLSVGTGVIALSVLNWPLVVVFAREALEGVSDTLREGSLALGATRFQTLTRMILPAGRGALIDGLGLSVARMTGEAAALIYTAGVNVSVHWGWFQPGEGLAVHLWYVRTEGQMPDRAGVAAATGLVLLLLVLIAVVGSKWLARAAAAR